MASRISGILPLLIITLCCIAAVESGYQALEYYIFEPPNKEIQQKKVSPQNREPQTAAKEIKKYDHRIILERNLFGPPPSATPNTKAPAILSTNDLESTKLDIVLMGTIIGGEQENRAFILDKKTRRQEQYRQGDYVQDAMVKQILQSKVILSVDGVDEILDISEAANMRPKARPSVKQPAMKRALPSRPTLGQAIDMVPGPEQQVENSTKPKRRRIIRPRVSRPKKE